MELKAVQQYLKQAAELIVPDEIGDDIEVAFEIPSDEGKPRYYCFNVCTIYPNPRLVVFSMEGPVVEVFRTAITQQPPE